MQFPTRTALAAAILSVVAACADPPHPTGPEGPELARLPAVAPLDPERARDERIARRLALALNDPQFRAEVFRAGNQSRHREGRVHLQRFLLNGGRMARLARANREAEATGREDLSASPAFEVYLPVPDHRARWRGGTDLLVATARKDGEAPVAFDVAGRRQLLDPDRPPSTPVLAVQAWEGNQPTACGPTTCAPEEDPPPGPPIGTPEPPPGLGLFMTGSRFFDEFESWLKGEPEFEIHVLGHKIGTTELVSYQCAGERAGPPYQFNQDNLTWSGAVMLFSRAQLDDFQIRHPGQGLRFLVVEDDDGPCEIRVDRDRVTSLFKSVDSFYTAWTSGKEVKITEFASAFQKAKSTYQLLSGLASFFKTNDDVVGTAVEDPAAAGMLLSGARWIVKGTGNSATGALRLEMR